MADTPVAIVGGGLAGLNAARLLKRSGVEFTLFEARDRPGGRILTVNEDGQPHQDGFDLGPSWFWPEMQPAIGALVTELALPSFGQYSRGDIVFERMSREAAQRLPGLHQEPESMRLVGGSASLIQAVMRDLPRDRLQFGAQVTGMRLAEANIEMSVRRTDGRMETVRAVQVIAAVPPRILATVRFEPAQERKTRQLWQDTPTWMAPHAKFFAIYDRPFWRDAGFSGTAQSMVGPLAEIHDATTASGRAALFGFVGFGAQQRATVGEAMLIRTCIEQLTRIFGPKAANPRATLYKDWASDPLTAIPADATSVDHPHNGIEVWLVGPWRQRLCLAGSETSANEAGYLSGAIEASERAVAQVMEKLAGHADL